MKAKGQGKGLRDLQEQLLDQEGTHQISGCQASSGRAAMLHKSQSFCYCLGPGLLTSCGGYALESRTAGVPQRPPSPTWEALLSERCQITPATSMSYLPIPTSSPLPVRCLRVEGNDHEGGDYLSQLFNQWLPYRNRVLLSG